MLHKLWGGPPGPGGTPFVPLLPRESGPSRDEEPARGPAADQGVRPTTYASVRSWEKLVALGDSPARPRSSPNEGRRITQCRKLLLYPISALIGDGPFGGRCRSIQSRRSPSEPTLTTDK